MELSQTLAERLPDVPRWVEARALLQSGECEVFGMSEAPELSFVVRDPDGDEIFVVGSPSLDAVERAIETETTVVAAPDQRERLAPLLSAWTRTRVALHLLRDDRHLPDPGRSVRLIEAGLIASAQLPEELEEELEDAAETTPVAATFVDDRPVSFSYAASVTESLWDISVDTVPDFRRRGYAGLCVSYMVRHMRELKKEPVWASADNNPPSGRLADKLGFVVVDELVMFEPSDV